MPSKANVILLLILFVVCSACTNDATRAENEETKLSSNLSEGNAEESRIDAYVEHAAATSSDAIYRIESFGVVKNVTAGGLYPAEGIRLVEIESGKELWSMSPGYFVQSFLWSPNNRYVAVYIESRISGETFIVDTKTMTEIPLPFIEQVRDHLNASTTVNEYRPDPYFTFMNWVEDDQISVAFQWTGTDNDGYEGTYIYNVTDNKLVDVKLK